MARLDSKPYPGNWEKQDGESFDQYLKRTEKMFDAIPQERVISFGVADGTASYYVKSLKPLVLQHIPFGDAYMIPIAHIRGLRESDVRDRIESEKNLREIFEERS